MTALVPQNVSIFLVTRGRHHPLKSFNIFLALFYTVYNALNNALSFTNRNGKKERKCFYNKCIIYTNENM